MRTLIIIAALALSACGDFGPIRSGYRQAHYGPPVHAEYVAGFYELGRKRASLNREHRRRQRECRDYNSFTLYSRCHDRVWRWYDREWRRLDRIYREIHRL